MRELKRKKIESVDIDFREHARHESLNDLQANVYFIRFEAFFHWQYLFFLFDFRSAQN